MSTLTTGRQREVAAIVAHDRAVEVAKLLMGRLNGPMRVIFHEDYHSLPRRNLRSGKQSLRDGRQDELKDFCQRNFGTSDFKRLAALYERLYANRSELRLSLNEFAEIVGQPPGNILRGAPRHSTIALSPWGLQTEYPEMHLARDMACAFNEAFRLDGEIKSHGRPSWADAKRPEFKEHIAHVKTRATLHMRTCILSCFNLAEAYINGIAWDFVETNGTGGLSKRKQALLTDQATILDKLTKVPEIVAGSTPGPLSHDNDPLKSFKETIKPFRDSIVHASPFSAPGRFGGYDKLSNIYDLSIETVADAVNLTIKIIAAIHQFVGGDGFLPKWLPERRDDGTFVEINW